MDREKESLVLYYKKHILYRKKHLISSLIRIESSLPQLVLRERESRKIVSLVRLLLQSSKII